MKSPSWVCLLFCVSVQVVGADDPTALTLAQSSLDFSWDAYRALKATAANNVFFSPYSITNALSMLVLGSNGTTQATILKVLDFPSTMNTVQLHQQLQAENTKLSEEKDATIGVANRFFVADSLADKVNPDYATNLKSYYNATVAPTPFATDPSGSRETINEFVSENTHGEIPQLLSSDLPKSTILSLVNAIYFKGIWTVQFDTKDTSKMPFHAVGGDVQTDFMKLQPKTSLLYNECENADCQLVILPYTQERKYAMVFVVPKEGTTLKSLEAKLNPQTLRALLTDAQDSKVNFMMPKFNLDNHFSLKDMLKNLGGADIFGGAAAADSIIFTENEGLLIDDVIHEAKIKVDKQGTVAAAATAVIGTKALTVVIEETINITLDRPFLFFIVDMSDKFVLFWGRLADPTQ